MGDANPFGETNPFESGSGPNPFADSSVTSAAAGEGYVPPSASGTGDDPYNAFSGSGGGTSHGGTDSEPLFAGSATSHAPAATAADAFKGEKEKAADLAERERRLREKELELERRQAQLASGASLTTGGHVKNWPPCFPFTYHSINDDIAPHQRHIVRKLYYLFFFVFSGLWWNWFCNLVLWVSSKPPNYTAQEYQNASEFLWSAMYAVIGTWGAWNGWYKSLYIGVQKDSSTRFLCFFIMFLAHCGFSTVAAIGVPSTSTVGILTLITISTNWKSAQDPYTFQTIISVVNTILWCIIALASMVLLAKTHKEYQGRGEAGLQEVRAGATKAVAAEAAGAMFPGSHNAGSGGSRV